MPVADMLRRLPTSARALVALHLGTSGKPVTRAASTVANCSGWLLTAELPRGQNAGVVVSPGWTDECALDVSGRNADLQPDVDNQSIHVDCTGTDTKQEMRISTPQMMDVNVDAGDGPIVVSAKLEGDFTARGARLDAASTIRGTAIDINVTGPVRVRKVLEAVQLDINGASLYAKKLMGERIAARAVPSGGDGDGGHATDTAGHQEHEPPKFAIDVESSYAKQAEYLSSGIPGHVKIGNHHGHAVASSDHGSVTAWGITGSAEIKAPQGTADVQFDSARGYSSITARGDVKLVLVPPVHVQLELRAPQSIVMRPGLTGVFRTDERANAHASSLDGFHVKGTLVVKMSAPDFSRNVDGLPVPGRWSPTKPAPQAQGSGAGQGSQGSLGSTDATATDGRPSGGSGKIRDDIGITGWYARDANTSGNTSTAAGAAAGAAGSTGTSSTAPAAATAIPTITVTSQDGGIVVEAVSWYELIKRKVEEA